MSLDSLQDDAVQPLLAQVVDYLDANLVCDDGVSPDELRMQFDHWASSCMEGYFIFSWDWMGNSLDGNTAQQDMLRTQNARVFGSGDTTPPSVPNLGAASPMPRS